MLAGGSVVIVISQAGNAECADERMSSFPYGLFELPFWGYVAGDLPHHPDDVPRGHALPAPRPVARRV